MDRVLRADPQHRLALDELRRRALRIRLLLTDVDGTLTDGGVYYSGRGEEMKRFDLRDGMGVERLRDAGIETAFITREAAALVKHRAAKLGVELYSGLRDKSAALPGILARFALSIDRMAFIGDDVNDLQVIRALFAEGLTGAPADAQPEVRNSVHYICARPGGHGAFREFAELLISLTNQNGRKGETP
jgi:3-deoxy-D-manno-octulosonate 8-phosphate phosphatase (KDO 8-P phosphatase)